MITYRIALIGGLFALSGFANTAQATELGAESIVHEQAQNQRALAEQRQYLASHEHYKALGTQHYVAPGVLPHHN